MLTDKYTTYKCSKCESHVPVGEVRVLRGESFCVTCLVSRYVLLTCDLCADSRNVYCYNSDRYGSIAKICACCLGDAVSVRRLLAREELSEIVGSRLGTEGGESCAPTSDKVSEKWKEITGCEVSS